MARLPRRSFLVGATLVGASGQLPALTGPAAPAAPSIAGQPAAGAAGPAADSQVPLRWLEGAPAALVGTTWGVPWPRGTLARGQELSLTTAAGQAVPVQSWPTAFWPDGSVKWTANAIGAEPSPAEEYVLRPGEAAAPATPLRVTEDRRTIEVDTGVIRCRIGRHGRVLVPSIVRGDRTVAANGTLVCLRKDAPGDEETGSVRQERFTAEIRAVTVEQRGPVRAVVRVEGRHRADRARRAWLPYTIRLYLYAGSDGIRMVHTFVFDGNEGKDFISGLGVRFQVPMADQPHDRHVRFAGDGDGVLGEAVRGITGLRRDPGAAVREAQVAGRPTPDVSTWDTRVSSRLHLIPAWGDYSLRQLSDGCFDVRKRTTAGHGWIQVDTGRRAAGLGYVGGISGGLAFGMKDFWQLHPTQLDIRGAGGDTAEITAWLWSPDATPMDLRFYHDGMGQDTYPEQLEGLEITYEDYEPGFGSPCGIARTTELFFWALAATPSAGRVNQLAAAVRTPPLVVTPPAYLRSAGVFGDWAPVDRSTPARAEIEDRLDFIVDYHREQVDQRSWYGFWHYGDVMHSYDADRHVWRYDVGGYAWDNSELSPDLWLWYQYLRSGRADVFRFAEAMTRHTGEVDVYHLGKYRDLGTRHGVLHWADSAKQLRISTAAYRRFYYFLTADERVGDLMRDLVDADRTFLVLDPIRKIRTEPYKPDPHALGVGFGTDWSGLAAAWLTEWERGGNPIARTKLLNTARTIAAQPNGFIQGDGLYDLDTGLFAVGPPKVSVGSLGAVFGLVEICSELVDLLDLPEFTAAWLQYCRLYNGTAAEQTAETGQSFGNLNLRQAHSRLTAYAAVKTGDAALAARAWQEFHTGHAGYPRSAPWRTVRVEGPAVLKPVDEASFVSTNASAQYGLAAIQCLALVGDHLP
jgi:hypothetical protein